MRQFRTLRISVEMLADMLGIRDIPDAEIIEVNGDELTMFGTIDVTVRHTAFAETPLGSSLRVVIASPTVAARASPEFADRVRAVLFSGVTSPVALPEARRSIQLDSPESAT